MPDHARGPAVTATAWRIIQGGARTVLAGIEANRD